MLRQIDGPTAGPIAITVGTTPVEAKVGAVALDERRILLVQPIDGNIYWGFDNTVSSSTGFILFSGTWLQLPYTDKISVWFVADGDVNVRFGESS